jgi:hypothetical protein
MNPTPHIRAGAALVTATVFLLLLSSIAMVLTERSVNAITMEQRRTEELTLALAAESAANCAFVFLQNNSTTVLRTDATYAVKTATLPTETQLDAEHGATLINSATLGMSEVNKVPVTARWCYLGQRAVRSGTNPGTGDWEITPLASFVSETATPLTPAQVTAGYVVQDVYKVRSLAVLGSSGDRNRWRKRQVDMLFTPTSSSILTKALFAKIGYNVQGSPSGDRWDSAGGTQPYSTATKTAGIEAGSNGSVSSSVPTITGRSNLNLTMPVPSVDLTMPYNIPVGGGGPNILNGTCTLTAGTYHARYIDITASDLVTINGNVTIYVDGPVTLQTANGSHAAPVLNYVPALSAKLTIIQADYDPSDPLWSSKETLFELNGNQTAGSVGNPQQFVLVSGYTGTGRYNGTAEFGGVIYAPNMTLNLNGNFDYFGAIMVNSFAGVINGNFHMHYDTSLANMALPVNAGFSVIGWYSANPVWGGGTIR